MYVFIYGPGVLVRRTKDQVIRAVGNSSYKRGTCYKVVDLDKTIKVFLTNIKSYENARPNLLSSIATHSRGNSTPAAIIFSLYNSADAHSVFEHRILNNKDPINQAALKKELKRDLLLRIAEVQTYSRDQEQFAKDLQAIKPEDMGLKQLTRKEA